MLQIDKVKLAEQTVFCNKWYRDHQGKGTLEAVTGFGKTYTAILCTKKAIEDLPQLKTVVVVPTRYLKNQWEHLLTIHGITAQVIVINTIIDMQINCDLLILDEIHMYTAETFRRVFDAVSYEYVLGLTATADKDPDRALIIRTYCPIIHTITLEQAQKHSWISEYVVYNVPVTMTDVERKVYEKVNTQYHRFFSFFDGKFDVARRALTDANFRKQLAARLAMTESDLYVRGVNWQRYMQKRQQLFKESDSKLDMAVRICNLFEDEKVLTFSQSISFIDRLTERIGDKSVSYHSKRTKKQLKEALELFNAKKSRVSVLNSGKALDLGMDIPDIKTAVITSGTSGTRQFIQRLGRTLRVDKGKSAIAIELYYPNTREERMVRHRQQAADNIIWVSGFDELVSLLNLKPEPVH